MAQRDLSPSSKESEFIVPEIIGKTDTIKIFTPRCSAPIIVEDGQSFTIQIMTQQEDLELNVYLVTAYEPIIDNVWCIIESTNRVSDSLVELAVSVPLNTPEELYNLSLLIEEDGEIVACSEPRAVQVVDTFSDSFSFIHIADPHLGDPRGLLESINETIGWKSIKKCIEEINLLHPDFVIITGDLVFGQLYPFEYTIEYKKCYDMIQLFDVPTFLVPGNHDGYNRILEDGLLFWESYFGPYYYSFDYGPAHFQAINSYDMNKWYRLTILMVPLNWGGSISDEQLQWITNDLIEHQESSLIFQFMHNNPIWETRGDSLMLKEFTNRENLLSLIDFYDVDMVFSGHEHIDSVTTQNDTIFVTTTTPESEIRVSDGYWGYRLIEVEDGLIQSYNYKEPKYSIPSYHLSIKQWNLSGFGIAEITNDLEIPIEVLVKFVLPLDSYKVNIGDITMQRFNEIETEIYVTTQVPALEKTVILVSTV